MDQATYLIGENNSGKTSMLLAFRCFFDPTIYKSDYLNKTEHLSRRTGYNRSRVSIDFDLDSINKGQTRKKRLISNYGTTIRITGSFSYREASDSVIHEYLIKGKRFSSFDTLDKDLQHLLNSITVSYIHPQEGADLLTRAQEKFKERLFNNWGRHKSVTSQLQQVQESWKDLRKTANTYLSSALTTSLKKMWPESSAIVNLPEHIEEIVQVSDIAFRSSPSLPEINLTEQGTGAQSIVLYQTHYVLDSDKSLHRGFYAPTWLLEEPESFLHTDISIKLGQHLNSDEWLGNIQMIISTHSPIILAASKRQVDLTKWVVFKDQSIELQKDASQISDREIEEIGRMMGDPNFGVYFSVSEEDSLLFIEDRRQLTEQKMKDAGIPVTRALKGTGDVKKHIDIFLAIPEVIKRSATFILDNDKGINEFQHYIRDLQPKVNNQFSLYKLDEKVSLLITPPDYAAEDLFKEFSDFLDECVDDIYNPDMSFKTTIPTDISRAVASIRGKKFSNFDDVRAKLKSEQDVKDKFWKHVDAEGLEIDAIHSNAIRELLNLNQQLRVNIP